jgi:F420-dependent oxidoreductase-like protein
LVVAFSVQTNQRYLQWPEILQLWQDLDTRSGFSTAWLVDHFSPYFIPDRDAVDGPNLEAWTLLSALAQATERIRVGVLVSCVTHRHPSVLAKMAATVDHISSGRLELALGHGFNEAEHHAYGIPFPPQAERFEMLDEALQVITKLCSEPWPEFSGKHYQLHGPTFNPATLQQPRPPITVGGNGERKTLRLVAEYADACNIKLLTSPAETRRKFDIIERYCQSIGRDPAEVRKTVEIPIVDDLSTSLIWDYVGRLNRRYKQGITREAAVGLMLHGSAATMTEVIDQYVEIGTDEVVLYIMDDVNTETLLRFSDDVIARF